MPATAADLLTLMAVLDNELDVGSGGADETRALTALVAAQHQLEVLAATMPKVLQTSTQTVATIAAQEQTSFPSALLRIDALWLLDSATNLPVVKLKRISDVGGHVPSLPWPLNLALAPGSGSPSAYYANSANFYWLPLPAGADTIRIYGLVEAAEFATRNTAYTYGGRCRLALATLACKLLNIGVGDSTADLDSLAAQVFTPLLKSMKKFDRSEPQSRDYTYAHTT